MRKITRSSDGYFHLALTNEELGSLVHTALHLERLRGSPVRKCVQTVEIYDAIAEAYRPNEHAVDDDSNTV